MATTTDKYIVEVSARLVGDEAFTTLTNRMQQLQRENAGLRKGLSGTGEALRTVRNASGNAAAGLGRMGGLFQNISYQFTDFVVQTTGGVSALRAFSQQAPQVAGALGAAGIGGAAGVATFAIASLAAAMVPAIAAMLTGVDAAEQLATELEFIEDRSIDIDKIFGGIDRSFLDLKNLTDEGERFREVLIKINTTQRQQTLDVLRQQLKQVTNEFRGLTETVAVAGEGGGMFGANYARIAINTQNVKELNSAFGLTIEQARELQPLIRAVINPPDGPEGIAAFEKLLLTFSTIKVEGEQAQKNVTSIVEALQRIIELNVQSGAFNFGGSKEDTKEVDKLAKQWERIAESVRTSNEEYAEQIALVVDLGNKLEKPKSDVDEILSRLSEKRGADLFKELAADTETFAGGVIAAVEAIDQMAPRAEYLAGIRQMMSQAANEEQWAVMAELLKDAATPAEQVRLALQGIREDAANGEALNAEIEKLRASGQATEEELKALEKQLLDTKDTAKTSFQEIGEALGQTLPTQVGRFVDTLYDAEASFSDMVRAMLQDIAKLITQMIILQQIKNSLGGSPIGDFLGIEAPSALGNVFNQGKIVPFATGGIVSSPTIFPMANGIGLMGEAGPEAIMPLSRGADGKLGVKSQPVTVNVINNSGATATVQESQDSNGALRIDVMIEGAVDSAIARGRFDKSLSNLYGLRRRGA